LKKINFTLYVVLTNMIALVMPILLIENPYIGFSFSTLGLIVLWHVIISVKRNYYSLGNLLLTTFFFHFFLLAPIIQLSSNPDSLINTVPVKLSNVIFMNFMLCIFWCVYSFKVLPLIKRNSDINSIKERYINPRNNFKIRLLLILMILLFLRSFLLDIYSRIDVFLIEPTEKLDGIEGLLRNKVLKVIPLFILGTIMLSKMGNKALWLVISVIFLIIAKNPITEHRNAFGSAYLLIFLVSFRKHNLKLWWQYAIAIISFPLMFSLGVYLNPKRFKEDSFLEEVMSSYNTVHFDAWANYAAGFDYIKSEGFYYGSQILSAILFWIPRSIWEGKGVGTGQDLGDYLMAQHNGWFNNISSPLPLEGYVDFGFIGVVFYGFMTGVFIKYIDRLLRKDSIHYLLGLYLAANIMFLFRGPLLSSLAFTIGGVIAWLIVKIFLKLNIK